MTLCPCCGPHISTKTKCGYYFVHEIHYKISIHFVFHRLEKTLRGEMFSTAELSHIKKFMQIALDNTEMVGYNITPPHSLTNLNSFCV